MSGRLVRHLTRGSVLARLRSLRRDEAGSFLVELALAIPVVMFLILATVEISRYALAHQKMNRLAAQISDLVGRLPTNVTEDMMTNTFDALEHVTRPFPFSQNGRIIISSVSPDLDTASTTDATINWQRCSGDFTSVASMVGTEGGTATMPGGFVVPDTQNAIVAEVYYRFEPLMFERFFFWEIFDSSQKTVAHMFVNPVRLGELEALQAGGTASTC